ncbi:MAG: pyridoxamine 5'-phosphate oxidase family protein [Proteobacteria bacterium]|nr:pyridoxamine 5'-phosphate oxidase family protein [Pseudomonadota bacterium]MBU1138772.1 pyridoxamine 5'-phosphate oxidase family protein [Pseudomonadota bacterium]MBU1232031.1 pyridoxamine 5'-phosphate oxidase family protein [Pseudomonadota bacterium]MBU1418055.1 pyridoxamine 5'-phosphate oxidase family protein [Pseudomonadota bacterium]MBU1454091.1 pyridoxamine 5'-phosphate oxidase family protein [Pseudomonadota bacterium]
MNLETYFKDSKGVGIVATSDKKGVVDTAIYSKPHILSNDEIAFIMRDRLTHTNLQENKHANYLFLEEGRGYRGVRLFLTKLDESSDSELIASMTRRHLTAEEDLAKGDKFLVRFKVNRILSLIGGEEIPAD